MKESENRNPCAAIYPVGGAVELMIQTALSTVFVTDSWKLRSAVPITAISRYSIPLDLKSGGIFYMLMLFPPVSYRESHRSASLFSFFCLSSIFDISFSFPLCYHFNTYYLADFPENKEILNEILELPSEKGNEAL